uniref:Gypsy retrotransposon integrase-like protein 1 n=1 Tax=Salmo trutta TaxID=8032 RepID=A0A673YAE7_SALTR
IPKGGHEEGEGDRREERGSGEPPLPYYAIRGLLYWVVQRRGEIQELLMVLRPYRDTVLQLAHSHVLGGHLARDKNIDRIMQRFYWPRVTGDVARYCRTCDQCQRTAPRPHLCTMDLVGPLPKSARGHEYILVVVDYATKFPEAITLRNMSSKGIAKELFMMFSRVGLPKTILTDQGTPFMSRLMKDLSRLYQVQQICTSMFHPQTGGLCERLNKTIKSMLRRVVSRDGKNWDLLLPHLMFACEKYPRRPLDSTRLNCSTTGVPWPNSLAGTVETARQADYSLRPGILSIPRTNRCLVPPYPH